MNNTEYHQMMSHVGRIVRDRALSEESTEKTEKSIRDASSEGKAGTELDKSRTGQGDEILSVSVYVADDNVHIRNIEMSPEEREVSAHSGGEEVLWTVSTRSK